jgi:hypothetical protein
VFKVNITGDATLSRLKNIFSPQDYWVLWTFPSSGILETRKHDVSETGYVSVLR